MYRSLRWLPHISLLTWRPLGEGERITLCLCSAWEAGDSSAILVAAGCGVLLADFCGSLPSLGRWPGGDRDRDTVHGQVHLPNRGAVVCPPQEKLNTAAWAL